MPEDTAALERLTNKVQDHSSALQALQVSVEHVVKTTDRMHHLAEKHGDLAHELARLRDVVDRSQLDAKEGDAALLVAIRELSATIKEDRHNSSATADEVKQFKGAIKALAWSFGVVTALLVGMGTMFKTSLNKDIDANGRYILEQKVRLDSLNNQVIELRLGQNQRDREEKR